MRNMKNAEREKMQRQTVEFLVVVVVVFCKRPCRVRLQTPVMTSGNYINSVVNVVASGAQILSKNCKHLYDCK